MINRNTLDVNKLATKLVSGKWMLPSSYHSNLCRMVQSYMDGSITYHNQPIDLKAEEGYVLPNDEYPIAVINVCGVISKGVTEIEEQLFGLVDVDDISEALDEAASDATVTSIYLNFSSPGGETVGVEELGRKIKYIDENIKPVYGWTESIAASAAYWLLSQCRKIGMIPSSQVGGVGVYSLIANTTAQLKKQGIDVEVFSSGKWKMLGHDFRTLTDAERDIIQKDVEKQHMKFKSVILSKRTIEDTDLEGLSFEGEDAIAKHFVDSVCDSFKEFLSETT